ncbi:MAG: aldehyde dehydrogenase family protein [Polyangiaceae bacterium]
MKLQIINPANGEVLRQVQHDTSETISLKLARARAAQPGWAARPLAERLEILRRFKDIVAARKAELAAVTTSEVGKPISQSNNEINALNGRIEFFLEHTARAVSEDKVWDDAASRTREAIAYEPLGVVANVSAWNYPYFVGSNVFVPALATGNTVLYKPSEFATLTGLELSRALHEAGVPEDVFVPIVGDGQVGAALVDAHVSGIFFTGSYATGVKIARAAAGRMVPVQLELGGKDPVYVADDVDIDSAAAGTADGAFYNTGQSCCAVERIYVHEKIYDAFVARFVQEVKGFKVGDPTDPNTYIGPLTREAQLAVLEAQVADARAKGGEVLTGGSRIAKPGFWFEPTVVARANREMLLMREESFGPIIGIEAVSSDEQALEKMNDTDYGLTAAVYTHDEARAAKLLRGVNAGSAYWNCCDRVSPRLPWSGRGHSGIGLTLSEHGIRVFTRPKAWHLRRP